MGGMACQEVSQLSTDKYLIVYQNYCNEGDSKSHNSGECTDSFFHPSSDIISLSYLS